LHGDFEPRFCWLVGGENRAGGEARHQQNEAGPEDGTENFVEFEGVHFRSGSRPEMSIFGRSETAAIDAKESGFCAAPQARDEISVCPCSGNPYKRFGFRPIPHYFRPPVRGYATPIQ